MMKKDKEPIFSEVGVETKPDEIQDEKEKATEEKILSLAMSAYGIWNRDLILDYTYYPEEKKIIFLTVGGQRASFKKGMKVSPLSKARIDGVVTKKRKGLTSGPLQ